MTTLNVLVIVFAIVGFIAAAMFATKKALTVLDKKVEQEELSVLAMNRDRFKNWSFVAGGVHATIVNYKWTIIYVEGSNDIYDNFHYFLETEYRQNARVTEYEYEQLMLTEEALRDCRANRILTNEDGEASVSSSIRKATVIDTDDYGTLVKYAPNQLVNVAGTKRMAAHLITNDAGDIFINEIHVAQKGFSSTSSVTIYHVADALGNRNKDWAHAFQLNVEAKRDVWGAEIKALNELKETLNKWNTHRHLVSFDTGRGVWIVQPILPIVPVPVVEEELVEEEVIVDPGKTEEATMAVTEADPAELALDAIGRMTQEQLDNLTRVLAESSGYVRSELALEEAAVSNHPPVEL